MDERAELMKLYLVICWNSSLLYNLVALYPVPLRSWNWKVDTAGTGSSMVICIHPSPTYKGPAWNMPFTLNRFLHPGLGIGKVDTALAPI
jgi:hypothetical protein